MIATALNQPYARDVRRVRSLLIAVLVLAALIAIALGVEALAGWHLG